MKHLLLLILLLAAPLRAQMVLNNGSLSSYTFVNQTNLGFSPTNIPLLSAWYVASDYTTNAGMATLPDKWTNAWNLTNTAGTASPYKTNISGYSPVFFDGGDKLFNSATTNQHTHDIIFVAEIKTGTEPGTVVDSVNSSYRQLIRKNAGAFEIYAGSAPIAKGPVPLNKLIVAHAIFNLAASAIYVTNQVSSAGVSPGPSAASGTTIGSAWNTANFGTFYLYEMVIVNTNMSDINRTNLYVYLRNKYAVTE